MAVSIPWLLRKAQVRRRLSRVIEEPGELPGPNPPTDPIDISSDDSFPASDPPSFTPTRGNVHRGPRKP